MHSDQIRPFFRSRWVPTPAHVRELRPDSGLPAGFRAAGVAAGIKPSGKPDVGLLVCDGEHRSARRASPRAARRRRRCCSAASAAT